MKDGIISRKGLIIIIIGFSLLIFGNLFGDIGGLLLFITGAATILGFIGGEIVMIIISKCGGIVGIISIILISVLFGYLSSALFGWSGGIFVALISPIIIIIYNTKARDYFNRP